MLKEMLGCLERHLKPPRHELRTIEETGIKTDFPFGRTIITASVGSSKDPQNEKPQIDFSARENAVWLTFNEIVGEQSYDFIIGPDGKLSPIAIRWNDEGVPETFILDGVEMKKIEGINTNRKAIFTNTSEDAETALIYKNYIDSPNSDRKSTEFYGIMRLPGNPGTADFTFPTTFESYISRETLVSGMKNRGPSIFPTSFWAVSNTDKSDLPFGRELAVKK